MSYGSLSLFYGGLESLLGPPQMHKDPDAPNAPPSLMRAMQNEHCASADSKDEFTTTNGVTTTSAVEWEFCTHPRKKAFTYPDRGGLHPNEQRTARTLKEMQEIMEVEANEKLRKGNHSEMIVEELLAGRLYTGASLIPTPLPIEAALECSAALTFPQCADLLSKRAIMPGPMYQKYNTVLRAKSKTPFLVTQCKALCKGNDYATSIHATNSCVLKLSKLTKAGKCWRGIKDATLPKEFWVPNEMGVRGGIEYGFSSTTTDKNQAQAYASGNASTIFEMQMGMVSAKPSLSSCLSDQHPLHARFHRSIEGRS